MGAGNGNYGRQGESIPSLNKERQKKEEEFGNPPQNMMVSPLLEVFKAESNSAQLLAVGSHSGNGLDYPWLLSNSTIQCIFKIGSVTEVMVLPRRLMLV